MMKTFGLIGYPLTHSFSQKYFTEKFQREKIADAEYDLFPLKRISEFPRLIKSVPSLAGVNVTIPYKESVIPFLDKLDPLAEKTGAVNCIKLQHIDDSKKLVGFNTDVFGFEKSLKKLLKPYHKKAIILGTGGASKAVRYVLLNKSIEFLLVSRKGENSTFISYNALNKKFLSEYLLIINTTPLGMFPNDKDFPPLPYHFISEKHLLYDLIYNPPETMFLKKGKEKGAVIKNGLEMLQLQAEKSWEIWNS